MDLGCDCYAKNIWDSLSRERIQKEVLFHLRTEIYAQENYPPRDSGVFSSTYSIQHLVVLTQLLSEKSVQIYFLEYIHTFYLCSPIYYHFLFNSPTILPPYTREVRFDSHHLVSGEGLAEKRVIGGSFFFLLSPCSLWVQDSLESCVPM